MAARENKILNTVEFPRDIKNFSMPQLIQLSGELRDEMISIISQTGGHLGAGLGVVELTVALHYVFNTPFDKLIWDVGHQCYPHKILTGRRLQMHTLRQGGGISGFPKRSESKYDAFGVGHSSTSISAGFGMAVGRDLLQQDAFHHVISVIGDGALSAGLAYEAMNNAGFLKNRMVVILNDNKMSIAPAVGAMTNYLNKLMSSRPFLKLRSIAKSAVEHLPKGLESLVKKTKRYAKDLTTGGNFFEEIGFHYIGPVDGHNIGQLVPILENIRDADGINSPILLHVKTVKGKGFDSPEECGENFHAVKKFDLESKVQKKSSGGNPSYTSIFADTLCKIAKDDEKIVSITAAMPSGTGMNKFGKEFPNRMFDVGIAEQHAVTFAAGLAASGLKPFACIYSTFLQRGYDQFVHDVAIQKLPVRFIIDRAGLVGADGPTHAGSFDIAYLSNVPNLIFMAPSCDLELARAIVTANTIDDMPSAIRFPRGEGLGVEIPEALDAFDIGKGKMVHEGSEIAVLSLGTRLKEVKEAHEMLKSKIDFTIADARFVKPLDEVLVESLAKNHKIIITIEEGSSGGFASHVNNFLNNSGLREESGVVVHNMFLPDYFIDQNSPHKMCEEAGLNANSIKEIVMHYHKKHHSSDISDRIDGKMVA